MCGVFGIHGHDEAANIAYLGMHALQHRGVVFVDRGALQPSEKGALTQVYLGGLTFELVISSLEKIKA